jgi:hypothetical protein
MVNKDNAYLTYLRNSAVIYAKKYALIPNNKYIYFKLIGDNGGDCANFISQCLYAGGASMIYNKQTSWWYNNNTCSNSWSVAHELYWYLKINNTDNFQGPKGIETTSLNELKIGDLIFFENKKNIIFHSTIITNLDYSIPLISQHTPNALNIPYLKSWSAYKYHFIKITF